jgi:hypothetical protein
MANYPHPIVAQQATVNQFIKVYNPFTDFVGLSKDVAISLSLKLTLAGRDHITRQSIVPLQKSLNDIEITLAPVLWLHRTGQIHGGGRISEADGATA